jgi:hypothetical protein
MLIMPALRHQSEQLRPHIALKSSQIAVDLVRR